MPQIVWTADADGRIDYLNRRWAEFTGKPGTVGNDGVRLSQVVSNLVTNAAKCTDAAGQIWLTAERENDVAVIRVRDNGIGLEPAMTSRIFELFVQARSKRIAAAAPNRGSIITSSNRSILRPPSR